MGPPCPLHPGTSLCLAPGDLPSLSLRVLGGTERSNRLIGVAFLATCPYAKGIWAAHTCYLTAIQRMHLLRDSSFRSCVPGTRGRAYISQTFVKKTIIEEKFGTQKLCRCLHGRQEGMIIQFTEN